MAGCFVALNRGSMHHLIEKLTGRNQQMFNLQNSPNSAILGSMRNLAQALDAAVIIPELRVGLWPIRSKNKPEVAMGIGMILALLLDRCRSIQVYRLLAQVDGDPQEYHWTITQSQFDIDEWQIDGLDENIAIWGSLDQDDNNHILMLEIESDLLETEETKQFRYTASSLGGIIAQLPEASRVIADYIGAEAFSSILPAFEVVEWDELSLENLLTEVFYWERDIWLWMWGKGWPSDTVLRSQDRLSAVGRALEADLGAWVVSKTIARTTSPVYAPLNEILLPLLEDIAETFSSYPHAASTLGISLFSAGERLRAYDLLEMAVENHPNDMVNWLALAELYWQGNEIGQALETFQRAINAETVSSDLYSRYADLLVLLHSNGVALNIGAERTGSTGRHYTEDLVLTDADEHKSESLVHEAIEAYKLALDVNPKNLDALLQLILHMIDAGTVEIWTRFSQLVDLDREGESLRAIVEMFHMLEDIHPGVNILKKAILESPDNLGLRINLAVAYLNDEQYEAAQAELEKARSLTTDPQLSAEIERLALSANDPEFEAQFGEIVDLINADVELSTENVEFLEDILDKAPRFPQIYVLLAIAYRKWGETEDALDVLLGGQKLLSQNPEIIGLLVEILLDSGEEELAFDYLNKGLAENPTHVGLLTLTGKCLFDNGQEDTAREFLQRAESLNPRHPSLIQARMHIAGKVSKNR